jgi:hypothetical protein
MPTIFKKMPWFVTLLFVALALPWLAACNSQAAPTLGQSGRPILAFIYTDN